MCHQVLIDYRVTGSRDSDNRVAGGCLSMNELQSVMAVQISYIALESLIHDHEVLSWWITQLAYGQQTTHCHRCDDQWIKNERAFTSWLLVLWSPMTQVCSDSCRPSDFHDESLTWVGASPGSVPVLNVWASTQWSDRSDDKSSSKWMMTNMTAVPSSSCCLDHSEPTTRPGIEHESSLTSPISHQTCK